MKVILSILLILTITSFVFAGKCDDLNVYAPISDLGGCATSLSQTTGINTESYILFLYLFGLLACLIFDFNASVWYTVYALIAYVAILIVPGDFATSLFASFIILAGFFIFRVIQKFLGRT